MKFMKEILFIIMFCVYPLTSWGVGERWSITGIYTDLSFNPDSGDVLGTEIIIGYSNKGYWAMFQYSEGEPSIPIVIPLEVSNHNISFNLPRSIPERGRFDGEILQSGLLVGKFKINGQKLNLRRGNSYWQ